MICVDQIVQIVGGGLVQVCVDFVFGFGVNEECEVDCDGVGGECYDDGLQLFIDDDDVVQQVEGCV